MPKTAARPLKVRWGKASWQGRHHHKEQGHDVTFTRPKKNAQRVPHPTFDPAYLPADIAEIARRAEI